MLSLQLVVRTSRRRRFRGALVSLDRIVLCFGLHMKVAKAGY